MLSTTNALNNLWNYATSTYTYFILTFGSAKEKCRRGIYLYKCRTKLSVDATTIISIYLQVISKFLGEKTSLTSIRRVIKTSSHPSGYFYLSVFLHFCRVSATGRTSRAARVGLVQSVASPVHGVAHTDGDNDPAHAMTRYYPIWNSYVATERSESIKKIGLHRNVSSWNVFESTGF